MPEPTYDYDVAISFRNEDLGFAIELRDGLIDGLRVFLYTDRQEELAGTDGLESFRSAFRHRSRLVVVAHRAGWGDTWWTRVECEAISDRYLKEGPKCLFVITMDDASPPVWIPEKLIRFSQRDFGTQQAIGAIKARALDEGSEIQRPTPGMLAQRAKERADFFKQRAALFSNYEGPRQVATEAARFLRLVKDRVDEAMAAAPELEMAFGIAENACGVRVPGVGLLAGYYNHILNALSEGELVIRAMRGGVALPGTQEWARREPSQLSATTYSPKLTREMGWCWKTKSGGSRGEVLSSELLAERFVAQFFDLLDRQLEGKLPPIRNR